MLNNNGGASLILLLWFALSSAAATPLLQEGSHELGSHGYLRAGGGVSEGETQLCYKAPGAGAKYRLGNECEVYGKASLYYRHQPEKEGGYQLLEVMPEFSGPYGSDVEYKRAVQSYLELGNLGGTSIDWWVGRRYNYRRDIHINDFFYMNLWGEGSGVRDIPLGASRLAVTYLQDRQYPSGFSAKVRQRTLDVSLYEVASNPGGKVMADLRYARIEPETATASQIHGVSGVALALQHQQQGVLGGVNTAALQYGRGAARSAWSSPLESKGAIGLLSSAAAADGLAEAQTWRLLDYHLFNGKGWAVMSSGLLEWRDSASFDGVHQRWASLGVRPIYLLTDHWHLAGELGYDRVNGQPSHGWLFKQTLALEWAPAPNFMSRPALRIYATHANWSDSYRGQIAAPHYVDQTNGWSAGAQLESWW